MSPLQHVQRRFNEPILCYTRAAAVSFGFCIIVWLSLLGFTCLIAKGKFRSFSILRQLSGEAKGRLCCRQFVPEAAWKKKKKKKTTPAFSQHSLCFPPEFSARRSLFMVALGLLPLSKDREKNKIKKEKCLGYCSAWKTRLAVFAGADACRLNGVSPVSAQLRRQVPYTVSLGFWRHDRSRLVTTVMIPKRSSIVVNKKGSFLRLSTIHFPMIYEGTQSKANNPFKP